MPRVVTLTFVDSDDNYGDDRFKGMSDKELAEEVATSLAEILAQEKEPLDYMDWKVEEVPGA